MPMWGRASSTRPARGALARSAAPLFVLVALLAWLWPIGPGGRMPVGGDVTQFFLGLMEFLGGSLRAGRVPAWNDLWGHGFPGVAESQMGVFYPPHWLFYRNFGVETAYVVSLVAHTLWGGLGAFWLARRIGTSPWGSALAAVSWAASGFFLVHLAHPWGYTTGCWMPWALGLAGSMLDAGGCTDTERNADIHTDFARDANRRAYVRALVLSAVLAAQILPGHFQLAFQTQVVLGLMVVWTIVEHLAARRAGAQARRRAVGGPVARRAAAVVLATVAVYPLTAIQVWPTARLAALAVDQRDFEYLSGFPLTPFHLVNFVAPGLFHRSPLWRPLVWDPFHAMPEECLTYIGLVPLFLAGLAAARLARRDAGVRLLMFLAAATLVLGLGPYAPGFRALIRLPGFSFFRAPARWELPLSLALALLAGKGLDAFEAWPSAGRWLRGCVVASMCWIALVLGVIELAVDCTGPAERGPEARAAANAEFSRVRWPAIAAWFDRAFRAMPWDGDPSFAGTDARFLDVMRDARRPLDRHVPREMLASVLRQPLGPKVFTRQRWNIYFSEIWESAALLAGIWLAAGRAQTRARARTPTNIGDQPEVSRADGAGPGGSTSATKAALLALALIDLWALGRHRLIDVAPIAPLTSQSPVLARLSREPRGTRLAGPLRNLAMRVGLAPLEYYRTLDLPAVDVLAGAAMGPMEGGPIEAAVRKALRASGTSLRLFSPLENRIAQLRARGAGDADRARSARPDRETIDDPALADWLYGSDWTGVQGPWAHRFSIWRDDRPAALAWFLPWARPSDEDIIEQWSGNLDELLALWDRARPLAVSIARPEEWTIDVEAPADGWVIVSALYDPQWTAQWSDNEEKMGPGPRVEPAFRRSGETGGWIAIRTMGPGRATLHLDYEATAEAEGAWISALAWSSWCAAALYLAAGAAVRPRRSIRTKY